LEATECVFITDCEGPISKNDNAFEVAREFIPHGERLFKQLSRYDDVLSYVLKRPGYDAGNTLKLIIPFLRSYEATDKKIRTFSERNITLMRGAKDTLQYLKAGIPSFIISTSYHHYVEALCIVLRFPFENTYCTELTIDAINLNEKEKSAIKRLGQEICEMPPLKTPSSPRSLKDFSHKERQAIERLDSIFLEEIAQMESIDMLRSIQVMGGSQKAAAVKQIVTRTHSRISNVVFVGDSITDVEALRLVREGRGLAVSYNGNTYAVKEADLAILSENTLVIAAIAQAFRKMGRDDFLKIAEDLPNLNPEEYGINRQLTKKLRPLIHASTIQRTTSKNIRELAQRSSSFRKSVRGVRIGELG